MCLRLQLINKLIPQPVDMVVDKDHCRWFWTIWDTDKEDENLSLQEKIKNQVLVQLIIIIIDSQISNKNYFFRVFCLYKILITQTAEPKAKFLDTNHERFKILIQFCLEFSILASDDRCATVPARSIRITSVLLYRNFRTS